MPDAQQNEKEKGDCPSKQQLHDFAEGRLQDIGVHAYISKHLETCEACLVILEQSGTLSSSIERAAQKVVSSDSPLGVTDFGKDSIRKELLRRVLGIFQKENSVASIQAGDRDSIPDSFPFYLGRYRIDRMLGQGGFGTVYLGWDSELNRKVAIKVPHAHRMKDESIRQLYLREARTVAQLDHPSIVPIYDYGISDDGRCFVVSKYIEGNDLKELIQPVPGDPRKISLIIAQAAEALHYIHERRIIHRDIKPANLLLDHNGHLFVADFGLAIRDEVKSESQTSSGTPSYMSPEQIRQEGHRIDGRSDQFSLGIVMYEMLTGTKPFVGSSVKEVFRSILSDEPVPPIDIRSDIPPELDRICLKLLSKLATQRYLLTKDIAVELHDWLAKADEPTFDLPASDLGIESTQSILSHNAPNPLEQEAAIIPRGLQAFSRLDAFFFPALLPGVRDRKGLPLSISNWTNWLNETSNDAELKRIGILAGPTGCGKTSLFRAGLLPCIESDFDVLKIEATPQGTEQRLRASVLRQFPDLEVSTLPFLLGQIRTTQGTNKRKPVLIVIDQFEQWLYAQETFSNTELAEALRHCDGEHLRCMLLVRDDFWLPLSRFMEALEVPIVQGSNAHLIDLFDLSHARKVLWGFGKSFEKLPKGQHNLTKGQSEFLDQAIDSIATGNKVVPVHLAIFAEMIRSRDWLPETLKQLGGSVGIGARFLNESFSTNYAPSHQRVHEAAVRRVLQALLPNFDTSIKGGQKTQAELLTISGYESSPKHFENLLSILESQLKLISAFEDIDSHRDDKSKSDKSSHSYQLSHDFLVPSIREWLSEKERATLIGRTKARFSEQSMRWQARHDSRFLPSFLDWAIIRVFVRKHDLIPGERRFLHASDRRSLTSIAICIGIMFLGLLGIRQLQKRVKLTSLEEQLVLVEPGKMSTIVDQVASLTNYARQEFDQLADRSETSPQHHLVYQIATLRWRPELASDVLASVLESEDSELIEFSRQQLMHTDIRPLSEKCWKILSDEMVRSNPERAWRAIYLLASFDPPANPDAEDRWAKNGRLIADMQIEACLLHPDRYRMIADSLAPCSKYLLEPLSRFLGSQEINDARARTATSLLSDYVKSSSDLQTHYALDAADWQRRLVATSKDAWSKEVLIQALNAPTVPPDTQEALRTELRRSVAAVELFRHTDFDREQLWNQLKRTSDQTSRTNLIRLLYLEGIDSLQLEMRLSVETDPGIMSALLIGLGDFPVWGQFPSASLKSSVYSVFQNHSDAGVHSAAEWLLRKWGDTPDVLEALARAKSSVEAIDKEWMVTPEGYTMVRVRAAANDAIKHDFYMATKETSVQQFRAFDANKYINEKYSPTPDSPANVVDWLQAINYCNWLSKKENLPPFYPEDPIQAAEWSPTADDAVKPGYRLPADVEWEFASRAGTLTNRYFGSDPGMIERYECTLASQKHVAEKGSPIRFSNALRHFDHAFPCGSLRPNELGLFDIYGNVSEWCNDRGRQIAGERAFRGGAASAYTDVATSSEVGSMPPTIQYNSFGFRIVRTIVATGSE